MSTDEFDPPALAVAMAPLPVNVRVRAPLAVAVSTPGSPPSNVGNSTKKSRPAPSAVRVRSTPFKKRMTPRRANQKYAPTTKATRSRAPVPEARFCCLICMEAENDNKFREAKEAGAHLLEEHGLVHDFAKNGSAKRKRGRRSVRDIESEEKARRRRKRYDGECASSEENDSDDSDLVDLTYNESFANWLQGSCRYDCCRCDRRFVNRNLLRSHLRESHRIGNDGEERLETSFFHRRTRNVFQCQLCDMHVLHAFNDIVAHFLAKHASVDIQEDYWDLFSEGRRKPMKSVKDLAMDTTSYRILNSVLLPEGSSAVSNCLLKCSICPAVCWTADDMDNHWVEKHDLLLEELDYDRDEESFIHSIPVCKKMFTCGTKCCDQLFMSRDVACEHEEEEEKAVPPPSKPALTLDASVDSMHYFGDLDDTVVVDEESLNNNTPVARKKTPIETRQVLSSVVATPGSSASSSPFNGFSTPSSVHSDDRLLARAGLQTPEASSPSFHGFESPVLVSTPLASMSKELAATKPWHEVNRYACSQCSEDDFSNYEAALSHMYESHFSTGNGVLRKGPTVTHLCLMCQEAVEQDRFFIEKHLKAKHRRNLLQYEAKYKNILKDRLLRTDNAMDATEATREQLDATPTLETESRRRTRSRSVPQSEPRPVRTSPRRPPPPSGAATVPRRGARSRRTTRAIDVDAETSTPPTLVANIDTSADTPPDVTVGPASSVAAAGTSSPVKDSASHASIESVAAAPVVPSKARRSLPAVLATPRRAMPNRTNKGRKFMSAGFAEFEISVPTTHAIDGTAANTSVSARVPTAFEPVVSVAAPVVLAATPSKTQRLTPEAAAAVLATPIRANRTTHGGEFTSPGPAEFKTPAPTKMNATEVAGDEGMNEVVSAVPATPDPKSLDNNKQRRRTTATCRTPSSMKKTSWDGAIIKLWYDGCKHFCPIGECDYFSPNRDCLVKHWKNAHGGTANSFPAEYEKDVDIYQCRKCSKEVERSRHDIRTHVKTHKLTFVEYEAQYHGTDVAMQATTET